MDDKQIDLEELIAQTPPKPLADELSIARAKRAARAPQLPRRVDPPFEKHRAELPAELEQAARQILRDFLLAESPASRLPAPRTPRGKPDPAAIEARDARSTIELIRAQYGPEVMRDIEFFIACVVQRPDGTPMRFQDSGAMIAPGRSAEAQRWAGYGALYRTLTVLAKFYARQRALGKHQQAATPEDKEVLTSILKRLADQRKNRQEKGND